MIEQHLRHRGRLKGRVSAGTSRHGALSGQDRSAPGRRRGTAGAASRPGASGAGASAAAGAEAHPGDPNKAAHLGNSQPDGAEEDAPTDEPDADVPAMTGIFARQRKRRQGSGSGAGGRSPKRARGAAAAPELSYFLQLQGAAPPPVAAQPADCADEEDGSAAQSLETGDSASCVGIKPNYVGLMLIVRLFIGDTVNHIDHSIHTNASIKYVSM